MNHSLVALGALGLACSCTSVQPQSHKPPSYYGRTDAEIAAMESRTSSSSSRSGSSQTMRTEYTSPYKRGDLILLIGQRKMRDESAWSPNQSQLTAGIGWSWEPTGSLIGFDTAFYYSEDSSSIQTGPSSSEQLRGETYEFSMGAIKSLYLGRTPLRAYIGAGAGLISSRLSSYTGSYVTSGSDTTFGGYGRVGLVYQIAWDGHIGVDYRAMVGTDSSINGQNFSSDYDQFTFNFGTSF